jgi:polysaccharide export outer membrane protein
VKLRIQPLVAILLSLAVLTGCSLPRGAALQSEILSDADEEFPDIIVYPVTRDLLPVIARWPEAGTDQSYSWIQHGHGADAELRINPFDVVDLVIWDSEQNSLLTADTEKLVSMPKLRVGADGQIFIPYVGDLRIAGRTPDAARQLIQRAMETIVPSAQVQLSLVAGNRSSVNLVSGANAPGLYPLPEQHFSVLNLISTAGGPRELANPQVRLIRGGKSYRIALNRLYETPELDTVLRGGDKVLLEADDRYFRALGATGTEQIIKFDKPEISALDAMALVGGLSDSRANPKGVLVLRDYPLSALGINGSGPSQRRVVFTIDLTSSDGLFSAGAFAINSQDTVLVTESPLNTAQTVFSLIGSLFGLAGSI